LGDGHIN
jgi:hypothetical protein